MLFFENRDGELLATMKMSALTAAKDEGWTLFEGELDAEEAAKVCLASNSGDLVVVFGEKRRQAFVDSPQGVTMGSRPVSVAGRFLGGERT